MDNRSTGDDISYFDSQTGLPHRDFRPRRPHTKSKHGCNQCKNRRIKCDEIKPRCTRCERGDLLCRYPGTSPMNPRQSSPSSSSDQGPYMIRSSDQLAPSTCSTSSRKPCPIVPTPPGLASDSMELFDHYVQHTSRAVNFDAEDAFALQVGIPALSNDCPALAATIMALAATCRSVEIIISHPAPIPGDRERVMDLLGKANRHHLRSLPAIRTIIAAGGPGPNQHYDHVLANAWLMAAYGMASHRLRIWLATTQPAGEFLAEEFLPNQSGWISLLHVVHAVYMSILGEEEQSNQNETLEMPSEALSTGDNKYDFPTTTDESGGLFYTELATGQPAASTTAAPVPFSEELIFPSQPPMHLSHHPLYDILISTSSSALHKLRQRVQSLTVTLTTTTTLTNTAKQSLTSCHTAIDILSSIAAQIRATSPNPINNSQVPHHHSSHTTTSTTTSSSASYTSLQPPPPPGFHYNFTPTHPTGTHRGRFSELSPWLRTYLSRALAVTPSRPFRRVLLAFLYRVPKTYLDDVQRILDSFPLSGGGDGGFQQEQAGGDDGDAQRDSVDGLVVDVFAHWLAWTLLMEGVWFFGEVGYWELGRIVGMVWGGSVRVGGDGVGEEEWWPGMIYRVAGEMSG